MAFHCPDYNFVFIHISKTGGTSITKSFKNRKLKQGRADVNTHIHTEQFRHEIGQREYDQLFKFSFVRNPWERMWSLYNFILGHRRHTDEEKARWIEEGFNKWLMEDPYWTTAQLVPWWTPQPNQKKNQLDWITDGDGNIIVDFIGRFENLQEDYDKVCDTIGLQRMELPMTQKTKKVHYRDVYSEEAKHFIEHHFKKDIEMFNYRF